MKFLVGGLYPYLKPSSSLLFIVGFILSVTVSLIVDGYFAAQFENKQYTDNITQTTQSTIRNISINEEKYRIWFITTTSYSLTQPPTLVRLAQALFPVRHFVTWVLILETIPNTRNMRDHHLTSLKRFVQRFDINHIILPTNYIHEHGPKKRIRLARQSGLKWVIRNVQEGVLMFAPEHFAYDHRIFQEVRFTKAISAWPVGLRKANGLSSPVVSKNGIITGYFSGNEPISYQKGDMGLELGGYAVNVKFLKRNMEESDMLKLTVMKQPSLVELGFTLLDVQPMGQECSKIYVWRVHTRDHYWPQRIKLDKKNKNTNIEILMRKVYGIRYPVIVTEKDFEENSTQGRR